MDKTLTIFLSCTLLILILIGVMTSTDEKGKSYSLKERIRALEVKVEHLERK